MAGHTRKHRTGTGEIIMILALSAFLLVGVAAAISHISGSDIRPVNAAKAAAQTAPTE